MRMDGDPHLTAWGSLDAEPIGGQRAMDLIPQQVVGGYFLMGTEEKGRVTQPSRPGIPEEQGGPVPVSCQGGEPLLQPLGVLEGGHDQAGEENAPLALSTLDSSLDSAQKPSSYCTFESPSETAPAPLSPDPLSQLPDQNVISPTHSPPEEDHPSEYLLDVLQLLVPGPALPPDTDSLPHCPPAPARQMLVPHDGLLDLDKTLLFASETRQSDGKPLCFDNLTPETDQIPPAECLPRIDDHSLSSEASVDPFTGHFPRSDPLWDLDVVEWPQSESNLDFGAVESSRLDSDAAQLPPSESCLEPDTVQLPRSGIRLNFDADRWSQSRFCSDPLPQSECCLNSDVDELPEAATCLELSAAELPEADSCVLSDANDLDEVEAFLDLEGDLPEAEACLSLRVSELPESDTYLSPGIGDLPEAESFALHDVGDLPEAESFLSPEVGEWPEAEAGLNTGSESTEAASGSTNFIDYLSQPVSCLHSDVDQLPQSDSCLDSEQLSQAESCLHPDTNQFSCLNPESDLVPQPTSDADQLPQIESHLHSVAHPKSHVDHNIHHLISSLASGSEQLAQSDGILDQDTNKLPQATACSDTDSNLLLAQLEYCLHPGSGPLPTFHSFLDPESNQITQSESLLNSDVDQIDFVSQSESSLAADIVFFPMDEPCSAPEMLSQSDLGQNSDHPTQSECCLNSQSEQVPDACLDDNTKQLARCDSNLSLKIDRWPLSDSCSQPDPNHLAQSDCLISPEFVPCSESEHCLNTDNLSQFNSYLELDTVQFSQTEFSLVLSGCESPNSGLSPVIDHSPPSGLCLDSDTELLPLSETFLAHENDKLICSVSESDSGLMSQSETSSSNDQMPLFSDFADEGTSGSEATHSDHLVICENPLTHNSDQLPMTESGLCDDSEFYCLCETFLAIDTDQISLPAFPEAPDPDHLPVSESVLIHGSDQMAQSNLPKDRDIDRLPLCDSVLACDADHFHAGKSFLPQDALPFTMTDHLAEIRETCLDSDSGGLLKLHSCLNDDGDQVSVSESSHIIHELPLPDSPLPSPADQLPPSEPFFAFKTADRLPLCNSSVANTSHLPSLESYLGLDHDNFDSSLHNHLPLSGDTDQFIESSQGHLSNQLKQSESFHDLDLLPLSECLLAPNFDDLNLSDLCFTPDIDEFPLGVTSVDPDNEISLFDEFLACDAHQSLQPESIVTPTRDEFGLFESCLSNDTDRSLLSHMSVLPHKHQLPFSDANVLLEEDNAQSCQSLISSNVDHPLSESFLESSTGQLQLPQSVSYLASDVDQPESAYRSSLVSASHFSQMTPANTSFSNSIVEEFQISWDWTSDLDHAEFTGVGLDCGSDVLLNLCPDGPASQVHEMNDCLPLFCLDTPPESPIDSPEIDPLTLSDDLLSLCDVFSQLQANNDITCPEIVDGDLCCALDGLSLQQTDSEFRTDQVSRIEEEMSQLGDPQVVKLPHMPTPNGQVDTNVGGDQTSNGISDHYLLDHDVDQSESYCLDLLFEPKLDSCEMQSSPSSSSPVNPCPQLHFDPSFGSIISAKVAGHLRCDVTKPSQSHVDETQSTPPLETLCFGDHLPPACHSDPSLHNMLLAQSNSYVATEMGSTSELLGESVQLPSIVRKEPLDGLTENNQDVLLARSREALPPDKLVQPEVDTSIEDEEVSPCDLKGPVLLRSEEPDCSQVFARLSGSGEQIPPEATTHSKPTIGFESPPSLPGGEQIEKLALSHTASPLDNTQVLPCDSHHPADSQDSASAPFSFGEGDPFLGFALDNDSPCVGDELARLRAVFDALDRDKDGFVKMEDFVQFATVYGAEQVKYLTGYLDPAGLGVINFRDFYRGISEIQNEDLDMQLYDMGYPSEGEPACSVDFDDLAAFEVTEVTDSAYVGSESAYSECETFTDEDTGGLAAQEDPETEGDGAGSRRHTSASPEGLELSLCDISVVTVAGQEEQFEDFGEGAEPDLFNSHCEDEPDSFTQTSNSTQRLTSSGAPVSERQLLAPPPCPALGGLYCSQCHKHINRLEDLSTRLRYLEMDSPDKRTCSRKEARRLHNSGFLGEEAEEEQETHMAYDETDLTDKVLYLEQRVSELERDAATTSEQQNRLRQENLQLLHRVHALEEQLKDQELLSDEVQSEETRKHRDELRKVERDRGYELSSLKARLQELENENTDLRSQLPSFKATTQRLEEEKYKLLDQVEDLQRQLQDHQDQNRKLGGKLSKELHKQQTEKERCQEIIEELRRELEQMQLIRLEMEQKMGLGNSAALQEYNSRTREAELEQEVRRLKQEQRALKEQNEELNGQIINLSIQGAKNLFSTTFSDSLAAEISSVSRDELMEAIQKQEEINLRLQDYIDRIIVAIMETNPAILEVKFH